MGSVVSLIGDGRSRRRLIPTLFIYPNHKQADACGVYAMYAFGLPDGRVKVGIARNPRNRLVAHARTHNAMSWCHVLFVSDRRMAERAERAALTALSALCERIGRSEMFHGASRDQVIAAMRFGKENAEFKAAA